MLEKQFLDTSINAQEKQEKNTHENNEQLLDIQINDTFNTIKNNSLKDLDETLHALRNGDSSSTNFDRLSKTMQRFQVEFGNGITQLSG